MKICRDNFLGQFLNYMILYILYMNIEKTGSSYLICLSTQMSPPLKPVNSLATLKLHLTN